jgi:hypothetical protein
MITVIALLVNDIDIYDEAGRKAAADRWIAPCERVLAVLTWLYKKLHALCVNLCELCGYFITEFAERRTQRT